MAQVEQTPLPGVGVRYDFTTGEGRRLGVVHHQDGRKRSTSGRATTRSDAAPAFSLDDDEVHTLVEVLGGLRVTEGLVRLQEFVEGLAIEWLKVGPGLARSSGRASPPPGSGPGRACRWWRCCATTRPTPPPGPSSASPPATRWWSWAPPTG